MKSSTMAVAPLAIANCKGVRPEGAAFDGWYPSNDFPRRSIMKRTTGVFPAKIAA